MNTKYLKLNTMLLALISCYPAISLAAAPTSGAYVTDAVSTYMSDETTQALSGVNSVMCFLSAVLPGNPIGSGVINQGPYVAMVDQNKCSPSTSGSKSSNSGPKYQSAIVNEALVGQADGSLPLQTSVWFSSTSSGVTSTLNGFANSLQGSAGTSVVDGTTYLPYGLYSVNWCQTVSSYCDQETGFITADVNGLGYYDYQTAQDGSGTTTEVAMQVIQNSDQVSGGGEISTTVDSATPTVIDFSYDKSYFLRSDDAGVTLHCFDRSLANVLSSSWSYGVYNADGSQYTINSGFPMQYTDSSGVTQNGYIGYYGIYTSDGTTLANGATVNQVDYSSGSAVTTAYTLLQSDSMLIKHVVSSTTLASEDKVTFWYTTATDLTGGNSLATAALTASGGYVSFELYWDDTNQAFYVSGVQNQTTYNMDAITPVAVSNATMASDATYGLNAWTQSNSWSISNTAMADFATTLSSTAVYVDSTSIVYPDAAPGTLTCILDCPQSTASGGTPTFYNDSTSNTSVTTTYTYTLDSTTGDLIDGTTSADVINATSTSQYSDVFNTQGSGKLVDATVWATVIAANATGTYTADDFAPTDSTGAALVTTFYTYQSSTNNYDQLSALVDSTGAYVKFDTPVALSYTVPTGTAYGTSAGATLSLLYNGFGDLQGVPTSCIDSKTGVACDVTVTDTTYIRNYFQYLPDFTIPAGSTVTDSSSNTYYVKALDVQQRFAELDTSVCAADGLALPTTAPTLPTIAAWVDPALGAAPTPANPAPQVIQGVQKY